MNRFFLITAVAGAAFISLPLYAVNKLPADMPGETSYPGKLYANGYADNEDDDDEEEETPPAPSTGRSDSHSAKRPALAPSYDEDNDDDEEDVDDSRPRIIHVNRHGTDDEDDDADDDFRKPIKRTPQKRPVGKKGLTPRRK